MNAARILWYEGDGNVGVGSGGGVVAVSVFLGGTRGSDVLSSAGDVLEMSVVRAVGEVCDMCMYLARGGVGDVGGEWVRGLGLSFNNSGGPWGNGICVCVLVAVVLGESGWEDWARVWKGVVVLCMCVL